MKKSLIFKILYLFLGLVVMAGASVFATNTFLASQVTYGNTNVENALNDLYTLKGNDENYSTDEKIVGKWIDGKPIYRKVLNLKSPSSSSTNGKFTEYDLPGDFDRPIDFKGYVHNSTYNAYYPLVYDRNGVAHHFTYYINSNTKKLCICMQANSDTTYFNQEMTIILDYTKTTNDPANN